MFETFRRREAFEQVMEKEFVGLGDVLQRAVLYYLMIFLNSQGLLT